MSLKIGEPVSFTAHFETAAGADVDPTVVKFYLREEIDGTELEWTYAAVPVQGTDYPTGQNPVVKDSTGDYSVAFVARKAERITSFWKGTGNSVASITTTNPTLFVRHSEIHLVEV